MDRVIEFGLRHIVLVSAVFILVGLLIALEVYRRILGSESISPNKAVLLMNREGAVILDVRSRDHFKRAHLPGAQHVSIEQLKQHIKDLSSETPIILSTDLSQPSYEFVKKLRAHGLTRIYHIAGGIQSWENAHLPLSH